MILSSSELKQQLVQEYEDFDIAQVPEFNDKKAEFAKIGNEIKRMVQTNGWKILEAWLLRQIDIMGMLIDDDEKASKKRRESRAYAKVIQQIHWWIIMGEKAESIKTD